MIILSLLMGCSLGIVIFGAIQIDQGDQLLTDEQLTTVDQRGPPQHTRNRRQIDMKGDKWPNATVYYLFDDSLGQNAISAIQGAIQYFEENTCMKFKEDRKAENRIRFFNGTNGCWGSHIGMAGREQYISLRKGCDTLGIVYHEILHALGYVHNHVRYDRDDYLQVNLNKIFPDVRQSFEKFERKEMEIFTPFEYGSVMQYDADAFTTDGTYTILPRDKRYLWTMGSRIITFYDKMMVNKYYCEDSCTNKKLASCANGGVPNPTDCLKCICPSGYGGQLCDQRPPGCGAELYATSYWQETTVNIGTAGVRNEYSLCNYWIRAPNGKKPQTLITFMPGSSCMLGCLANGIQFKTEDQQATNVLYCCKNSTDTYGARTSQLNPMPVIVHNREDKFPVTFRYRYV